MVISGTFKRRSNWTIVVGVISSHSNNWAAQKFELACITMHHWCRLSSGAWYSMQGRSVPNFCNICSIPDPSKTRKASRIVRTLRSIVDTIKLLWGLACVSNQEFEFGWCNLRIETWYKKTSFCQNISQPTKTSKTPQLPLAFLAYAFRRICEFISERRREMQCETS